MKVFIKTIAEYLPETILTNEELVKEFPEWSVEKVSGKIGIYQRHISGENETATDMAGRVSLQRVNQSIGMRLIMYCFVHRALIINYPLRLV